MLAVVVRGQLGVKVCSYRLALSASCLEKALSFHPDIETQRDLYFVRSRYFWPDWDPFNENPFFDD